MGNTSLSMRLRCQLGVEALEDRTTPATAGPLTAFSMVPSLLSSLQGVPLVAFNDSAQGNLDRAGAMNATERQQARLEIRYMKFTIDHHAMGVQMAQMCQEKAVSGDLKDLCARIEEVQSQEIVQLQGYLKEWYGIDYQPQMSQGDQRQMERLERLSWAAFDIAISRMFIRHHEQIIRVSVRAHDRFIHPELKEFAHQVINAQSREIGEFLAIINSYAGHDDKRGGHRNG